MDSALPQDGQHHERTEVTVKNGYITLFETIQDSAEQRALAPPEGAAFWQRFRPASHRPTPAQELSAIENMRRALDFDFPIGLAGSPTEIEERLSIPVEPFIALTDSSRRLIHFYAGSENLDWSISVLKRLLESS